jgi:hypothetical protein
MFRVFLSYRRLDCTDIAKQLRDLLVTEIGEENVFLDVQEIRKGEDYRAELSNALLRCDILLALIGPQWLAPSSPGGACRLFDENDYVRHEIEMALANEKTVIPLLCSGASMPDATDLPVDIRDIVYCEAIRLVESVPLVEQVTRIVERLKRDVALDSGWHAQGFAGVHKSPETLSGRIQQALSHRIPYWLAQWGVITKPALCEEVHDYLIEFHRRMQAENASWHNTQEDYYVNQPGTEFAIPAYGTDYFAHEPVKERRQSTLHYIRRSLYLLGGIAQGGDQSSARLAAFQKRSKTVRNAARLVTHKEEPVVLLGDPGSGKSMTLRAVGISLAEAGLRKAAAPVIVYVRLGRYRKAVGNRPGEVLIEVRKSIDPRFADIRNHLVSLIRERRLIILFDGMDEMERKLYAERVRALTEFAMNPRLKVLFACRINDFSPELTHRQLVLLDFELSHVREYLRKNLKANYIRIEQDEFTPDQLAKRLWQHPDTRDTARNPFTLSLLCRYLAKTERWPSNRHELFESHIDQLIARMNARKIRPLGDISQAATTRENLWREWSRLAFFITNEHAGTSLSMQTIRQSLGVAMDVSVQAGVEAGLLVRDESDEDSVRFAHHRLQEYLTAWYLAMSKDISSSLRWDQLMDSPRWQETLLNLAAIVQDQSMLWPVFEAAFERAGSLLVQPEATSPTSQTDETVSSEIGDTASPTEEPKSQLKEDEKPKKIWELESVEEQLIADRVVLAARIIRELEGGANGLPQDFVESFSKAVKGLATKGRPTSQVKMLWAWSDANRVCSWEAIEEPLRSDVDWVREQALCVLGSGLVSSAKLGTDVPAEMAVELASGQMLSRFRRYQEAFRVSGQPGLKARVYLAAGCAFITLLCCLLLVVFGFWKAFDWWPIDQTISAGLPLFHRNWIRGIVIGLAVLAAWGIVKSDRTTRFSRTALYSTAFGAGVIAMGYRLLTGHDFMPSVGVGALVWLCFSGSMAFMLRVLHKATFFVYSCSDRIHGTFGRYERVKPILKSVSREATDHGFMIAGTISGCISLIVVYIDQITNAWKNWIFGPVVGFLENSIESLLGAPNLFETVSVWTTNVVGFVVACIIVLTAAGILLGMFAAVRDAWKIKRDAAPQIGPWHRAWQMTRSFLKVLLYAGLFLGALSLLIGIGAYLIEFLRGIGIRGEELGRAGPLLTNVCLFVIAEYVMIQFLRMAIQQLKRRVRFQSLEEWEAIIRIALPEKQAVFLSTVSYQDLRVTLHEFYNAILRLEDAISLEPAKSGYWQLRGKTEEIMRQSRLATISEVILDSRRETSRQVESVSDGRDSLRESGSSLSNEQVPKGISLPRLSWKQRAVAIIGLFAATLFAMDRYAKQNHEVFLVHGWPEKIVVSVDGITRELEPNSPVVVHLSEGRHSLGYNRRKIEYHSEIEIESTWVERLFRSKMFVLNVGGSACLEYYTGSGCSVRDVGEQLYCYAFGESLEAFSYVPSTRLFAKAPKINDIRSLTLITEPHYFVHFYRSYDIVPDEPLTKAEIALKADSSNWLLLGQYIQYAMQQQQEPKAMTFLNDLINKPNVSPRVCQIWVNQLIHRGDVSLIDDFVTERSRVEDHNPLGDYVQALSTVSLAEQRNSIERGLRKDALYSPLIDLKIVHQFRIGDWEDLWIGMLDWKRSRPKDPPIEYDMTLALMEMHKVLGFPPNHLDIIPQNHRIEVAYVLFQLAFHRTKPDGDPSVRWKQIVKANPWHTGQRVQCQIAEAMYLHETGKFDPMESIWSTIEAPIVRRYYEVHDAIVNEGSTQLTKDDLEGFESFLASRTWLFSSLIAHANEKPWAKEHLEQAVVLLETNPSPFEQAIAHMLRREEPPSLDAVLDLNISTQDKSMLFAALGGRFPSHAKEYFEQAVRWAISPVPPYRILKPVYERELAKLESP